MKAATINRPLAVGTRVCAHYTLSQEQAGKTLLFDRSIRGVLRKVERISPTVFRYHVRGDDKLDYVIPSQIGEIEPVVA